MKLYELLAMIAKGEVKEGTRIRISDWDNMFYKNGNLVWAPSGDVANLVMRELNYLAAIIAPDINAGTTTKLIKKLDDSYWETNMYEIITKLNEVIEKVNSL